MTTTQPAPADADDVSCFRLPYESYACHLRLHILVPIVVADATVVKTLPPVLAI